MEEGAVAEAETEEVVTADTWDNYEFNSTFASRNNYEDWDADNYNFLGEREYTDGVFGLWDDNAHVMLDENEYGAYNTYYGV